MKRFSYKQVTSARRERRSLSEILHDLLDELTYGKRRGEGEENWKPQKAAPPPRCGSKRGWQGDTIDRTTALRRAGVDDDAHFVQGGRPESKRRK